MKFRSLQLKNFQVHKDTLIEFSPTITTIRGPTDSGKSAVLRALRWVCLNDLAGEGFIREGTKKVEVILHVMEKKERFEILRNKGTGGSSNTYELDSKEFKSFGTTVPSDIETLLRTSDINFQGQHDPAFWFTDTAGEVSRKLNAIVDLSLVDSSLAAIATQVRMLLEKKTIVQERLTEAKDEQTRIEPQRERIKEFKQLSDKSNSVAELREDSDNLGRLTSRVDSYRTQAKLFEEKTEEGQGVILTYRTASHLSGDCIAIESLISKIEQHSKVVTPPPFNTVEVTYWTWATLAKEVEDLQVTVERGERLKQRLETTEPPPFDRVQAANNQRRNLSVVVEELEQLISRGDALKTKVVSAEEVAATKEATFHQKIKGQRCPLCENPIR